MKKERTKEERTKTGDESTWAETNTEKQSEEKGRGLRASHPPLRADPPRPPVARVPRQNRRALPSAELPRKRGQRTLPEHVRHRKRSSPCTSRHGRQRRRRRRRSEKRRRRWGHGQLLDYVRKQRALRQHSLLGISSLSVRACATLCRRETVRRNCHRGRHSCAVCACVSTLFFAWL